MRAYATPLLHAFVAATYWMISVILARCTDAVFLPQAFRFAGASLVLLSGIWMAERRLPRLSLRLFHAAVAVGGLIYFLVPVLSFYALRTVSSGFGALVFSVLPVCFLYLAYGSGAGVTLGASVATGVGLVAFYIGDLSGVLSRGYAVVPLICLVLAGFSNVLGIWICRRLFWLHGAADLHFWSMLFAAVLFLVLVPPSREMVFLRFFDAQYWILLAILSLISTGWRSFLGQGKQTTQSIAIYTVAMPLIAVLIGWACAEETQMNALTIGGFLLTTGGVLFAAREAKPSRWVGQPMQNDRRQGDRLICHVDAEIEGEKAQLLDLSLNGLGFRCQTQFERNTVVGVRLPIALDNSSLTLVGKVMHMTPTQSKEFPHMGGIVFLRMGIERRQNLIEFLARLTQAEEK